MMMTFKAAKNNNVSMRLQRALQGARDTKTNMAARCPTRKTLFPQALVSRLRYQLFSPSKTSILQAISNLLNRCART